MMAAAEVVHGLPHSVEAEQSVLGALLIDNAAAEAVGDLQPAAFWVAAHRVIWRAMQGLLSSGRPADPLTVHDALGAASADVGGLPYLVQLSASVASARNVARYAAIVRQRALRRQAIALGHRLIDEARDLQGDGGDGLAALVDSCAAELLALQEGGSRDEPVLLAELLPQWLDDLQARADGRTDAISTGLPDLDRALAGGFRAGELVVLGARPSMGKSALMLTLARMVAGGADGGGVLVASLEDSDVMICSRLVAAAGRANLGDIRKPRAEDARLWDRVTDGVEAIQSLPLYIDAKATQSLASVRRAALQVRRRQGKLALVVVDYLQLMEGETGRAHETRSLELATIARGMKRLAKELGCCVLLLSQLSREADKTNTPPRIDHLAESGGVEQAADVVILLWRKGRNSDKPEDKHHAQAELAKNKNGATCTVRLHFDGATQRFEAVAAAYGEDDHG